MFSKGPPRREAVAIGTLLAQAPKQGITPQQEIALLVLVDTHGIADANLYGHNIATTFAKKHNHPHTIRSHQFACEVCYRVTR